MSAARNGDSPQPLLPQQQPGPQVHAQTQTQTQTRSKNLKNLHLNLSPMHALTAATEARTSTSTTPTQTQRSSSNNSARTICLSPSPRSPRRTPSPTATPLHLSASESAAPPSTFRRMPSANPASSSPVTAPRKRASTTAPLMINIPGGENTNTSTSDKNTDPSSPHPYTDLDDIPASSQKVRTSMNFPTLPLDSIRRPYTSLTSSSASTSNTNTNTNSNSNSSLNSSSSSPSPSRLSPPLSIPMDSVPSYTSEIKPQTIMHSFNTLSPMGNSLEKSRIKNTTSLVNGSSSNDTNFKLAYPNGPICVLKPNLYLYAEPTFEELSSFDVIINVAQEIKDYSKQVNGNGKVSYYFIPWTHTSRLTSDFPRLTTIIDDSLKKGQKVLIHCQCGVSRSASLVMAYFMKYYNIGYNDAYKKLKEIVPQISPNLSLIYELIEWGEWLEKGQAI